MILSCGIWFSNTLVMFAKLFRRMMVSLNNAWWRYLSSLSTYLLLTGSLSCRHRAPLMHFHPWARVGLVLVCGGVLTGPHCFSLTALQGYIISSRNFRPLGLICYGDVSDFNHDGDHSSWNLPLQYRQHECERRFVVLYPLNNVPDLGFLESLLDTVDNTHFGTTVNTIDNRFEF